MNSHGWSASPDSDTLIDGRSDRNCARQLVRCSPLRVPGDVLWVYVEHPALLRRFPNARRRRATVVDDLSTPHLCVHRKPEECETKGRVPFGAVEVVVIRESASLRVRDSESPRPRHTVTSSHGEATRITSQFVRICRPAGGLEVSVSQQAVERKKTRWP